MRDIGCAERDLEIMNVVFPDTAGIHIALAHSQFGLVPASGTWHSHGERMTEKTGYQKLDIWGSLFGTLAALTSA